MRMILVLLLTFFRDAICKAVVWAGTGGGEGSHQRLSQSTELASLHLRCRGKRGVSGLCSVMYDEEYPVEFLRTSGTRGSTGLHSSVGLLCLHPPVTHKPLSQTTTVANTSGVAGIIVEGTRMLVQVHTCGPSCDTWPGQTVGNGGVEMKCWCPHARSRED